MLVQLLSDGCGDDPGVVAHHEDAEGIKIAGVNRTGRVGCEGVTFVLSHAPQELRGFGSKAAVRIHDEGHDSGA